MSGIRVVVRAQTALHLPFMFFFSVLLLFLSNSMCFSLCSVVHFFPYPFVFLFLHFLLLSITVGFSFLIDIIMDIWIFMGRCVSSLCAD